MQYGVSGSGDFCWKHKHFLAIFLLFFFLFAMHDLLLFISWRILTTLES